MLIEQLVSHGFVVVASLSSQPAQGTPLHTAPIGATGRSQGGAATIMAGAGLRNAAIAPIVGP